MQIRFLLNGKEINLTGDNVTIKSNNFNVDKEGNVSAKGVSISNGNLTIYKDGNVYIKDTKDYDNAQFRATSADGSFISRLTSQGFFTQGDGYMSQMTPDSITTPQLNQTSLESQKKNFEKLENALEEVKNTDIYKYNLKFQNDREKKHIGFVIGENYKYSKMITAIDKDGKEIGVDTYSMLSVLWKAVQELAQKVEELKKEEM